MIRTSAVRSGSRVPRSRFSPAEVLLLGIAIALLFAVAAAPTLRPQPIEAVTTVRVAAADTLWRIAERYPVPGAGTKDTVRAIRRMNGMRDSDIVSGQVLRVPDAGADEVASR